VPDVVTMDKIVSLARRRGFVFPSSEIYGGLGSSYDYGHYGVLLKENVKARWLEAMVRERDDIVALDSSVILNPRVWEVSGHVEGFHDPLVDCRFCKLRFRADQIEQAHCGRKPSKAPGETDECDLTEARAFSLMFETHVGPVREDASRAYLRPETAQGIFVNFKNVLTTSRKKPPFGIAQIGKSFRNEITPGNFIFRTREFEQMEMEFFVPPDDAPRWYEYWVQERYRWFVETLAAQGVSADRLQFEDHAPFAEHLRAYDRVDVALDPFPYPGGTTTRNALWCGVPVITLDARTTSPTATLLRELGLGACVAQDEQDYVRCAAAVAADLDHLATCRAALRAKLAASESFNAERFTRSLENAFRDMWAGWCGRAIE